MENQDIDITDILGKNPQEESSVSVKDAPVHNESEPNLDEILQRVKKWDTGALDLPLDLNDVSFVASDEDMYLEFKPDVPGYSKSMFFKADPENNTDARITHAQKQFCKMVGVPHGFFMANRPSLRMKMVETWQSGLISDEDIGENCIVRLRDCAESSIIRAFLPVNAVPLKNSVLLDLVKDTVPDVHVEFVRGDELDDLVFHGRFFFDQEVDCAGLSVCAGFSLMSSELGATPLQVEALLHINNSNLSFVASYGGESYFKTNYKGIQHDEITKMLPGMIRRIKDQLPVYIASVVARSTSDGSFMPKLECTKFNRSKGLPAKFKRALFHEVHENESEIGTPWDFARTIVSVAEAFDSTKRLAIERAAGKYLGMVYSKAARNGPDESEG
ncbi:MAG: hypothetical protein GF334_05145 [Candidatus Altiarchaeales archaeon]|nr:hypothetical protein [Candidatus Altiarchaeales archaeon]